MHMPTINDTTLHLVVATRNQSDRLASNLKQRVNRANEERGEGVISAAIAVLIFALIGGAMWVAYSKLFKSSSDKTAKVVEEIGNSVP